MPYLDISSQVGEPGVELIGIRGHPLIIGGGRDILGLLDDVIHLRFMALDILGKFLKRIKAR